MSRCSSETEITPRSPRVMTTRRAPMSSKRQGLANRVVFAQDERGLVGIRHEDIGVRQHRSERLEVVARPRGGHVEKDERPGLAGLAKRSARPPASSSGRIRK